MKWKMSHCRSRTMGFTSIEVLAATALASLLMVAVLGILAGIAKKEKVLESSELPPRWHDQIVRRLRADLSSASRFRAEPGRVIFEASAGNDPNHPDWLPTEIHYFVFEAREQSILLRQEHPRIQPAPSGRPEIVCLGADSIVLSAYSGAPGADSQIHALADGAIPPRLRIVLSEEGNPVLNRPIVIY